MISLIWAMDKNNLIGKENKLPWHYKEDLIYFREKIKDHPIILGDKTYESILGYRNGKQFPDSKHYVATIDDVEYQDCIMINDLKSFLAAKKEEEFFVIGGATIYKIALPFADKLYITHIDVEYDGDTYFPEIDFTEWNKIDEKVSNELRFCVYERKVK